MCGGGAGSDPAKSASGIYSCEREGGAGTKASQQELRAPSGDGT